MSSVPLSSPATRDRARGALVGLAAGDALGTTVEFMARGSFKPLTDIVGGGPFDLAAGQWTDDTTMAICLAESLVACGGFDPVDQLRRYVRWWKEGHNSPTGHCFDIGSTTRESLANFLSTGEPYRDMHEKNGGNGSLMRLAPIAIAYADTADLVHYAGLQSRTTHASLEAIAACQAYALMIRRAIAGQDKADVLDIAGIQDTPGMEDLPPKIRAVLAGSYREKAIDAIRGSGYVVESLEAALWCFWRATDFRDGALLAANLGQDADTTAAIYGQLAGAHFGFAGIDEAWRNKLYKLEDLRDLADVLFTGSLEKSGSVAETEAR